MSDSTAPAPSAPADEAAVSTFAERLMQWVASQPEIVLTHGERPVDDLGSGIYGFTIRDGAGRDVPVSMVLNVTQ